MKLSLNLDSLWKNIDKMGASPVDFIMDRKESDGFVIDDEGLSRGIEIELDRLEPVGGVLSIQGRQVLLYIPDHGGSIDGVLRDGSTGKKFHVANCATLNKMRALNRIERYIVTNDLSGNFEIYGNGGYHHGGRKGIAQLVVCKNCLKHLNYKGYKNGLPTGSTKSQIFKDFSLSEFFARHSTLFDHTPSHSTVIEAGYSDNWKEISATYRSQQNYCCEQCTVNLSQHKHLLHCHHVNGVKRDNSESNLKALCMDCHRKQPMHQHLNISAKQMHNIHTCRREQGLLENNSWDELLKLADTSFHGILLTYHKRGKQQPEIGYDIENDKQEVVFTAEIAWTAYKKAIVFDEREVDTAKSLGWTAITLNEALENAANGSYLI